MSVCVCVCLREREPELEKALLIPMSVERERLVLIPALDRTSCIDTSISEGERFDATSTIKRS